MRFKVTYPLPIPMSVIIDDAKDFLDALERANADKEVLAALAAYRVEIEWKAQGDGDGAVDLDVEVERIADLEPEPEDEEECSLCRNTVKHSFDCPLYREESPE